MRLLLPTSATALILLAVAAPSRALGIVEKIEVRGLDRDDEAAMIENIELALSLNQALDKRLGESRLEYLLQRAQAQARQALEPFGYYDPTITVDAPRQGERVTVVITVDKGQPVRVRESDVGMTGPAGEDRYLQRDLEAFRPRQGEIFDHALYESSKITITRRLSERGYFDADFTERKVEVTRADHAADILLRWDSGRRYDMGPVTFHQTRFRPGLLNQLVYWEEGSYYHQGRLDRLRESLNKLDYFSTIDIQTDPEAADDWRVPVEVNLTLANRDVYTVGLSYGTDSGAGVRLGFERRYVNSRGHKLASQIDWAQKRKTFTTQYRIPAFRWLDGWYTAAIQGSDEQTEYIDLRHVEFIASRSGELNERWTAEASLRALRERWRYGSTGVPYQYATFTSPELTAKYISEPYDRFYPREGWGVDLALRGGLQGAGSDASFAQVHGTVRWFRGLGPNSRLLTRGEFGATYTDELVSMPPTLRYFAGGDRSIRGYSWREVGPRIDEKYALGGKHVMTWSAEYEHYFSGGPWGMAAFVDSGSAFDDRPDWHTGVGMGLRWKSPVGPVRVDIARGLNGPDSAFQIHLNIGADL